MISIRISNLSKEDQSHYSKQNQEGEEGGILSAPELRSRSAPALWPLGFAILRRSHSRTYQWPPSSQAFVLGLNGAPWLL